MEKQAKISKREVEVLQLIGEEMTTKEIASSLYISHHTVITHRRNLMAKMEAKNSVGLYKKALQFGLVNLYKCVHQKELRWAV